MLIEEPGAKIRQIRELKNVTQESVALKLGISTRAYSKIETGETQLTINRLNEISQALDITPMEVLGFEAKQVFMNNQNHGGNIGINNVNHFPEKLAVQYEKTIAVLEDEVRLLKDLLTK